MNGTANKAWVAGLVTGVIGVVRLFVEVPDAIAVPITTLATALLVWFVPNKPA